MKKQAVPAQGKELLILDAAQQRFAAGGYSKSTMDEIANDVGMSKASLYYYFATKEAVFRAVVLREQKEFLLRADDIIRRNIPARDKVMRYILLRIELSEQLMNLNRFDRVAWYDVHPVFTDLFLSFAHDEERCLLGILREGTAAGEFAIAKPKHTAAMILHVLQGLRLRLVKMTTHGSQTETGQREWRDECLLFAETILNGMTTTTA
jgi:AcrR family transcriptional regulator